MTYINWNKRVRNLAQLVRNSYDYSCYSCGEHDPGYVDPRIIPALASYAQQLGYPVRLDPGLPEHILGQTAHPGNGENKPAGIYLRPGMSDASTARVMGHELGHAIDGPGRVTILTMLLYGEDPIAEISSELGAGAFTEAAHIGTRQFTHHYLGGRLHGEMPDEDTLARAADKAEKLWEAVHEGVLS